MTVLKYCGLALLSLSIIMVIYEFKPRLAKLAAITIGIYMLSAAWANIYPSIKLISEYVENTPLGEYTSTLLKALGAALAVEITADACRDAGEATLASRIEMIGKAELLLLALPLISKLIDIAKGLL